MVEDIEGINCSMGVGAIVGGDRVHGSYVVKPPSYRRTSAVYYRLNIGELEP